jgi:PAS domain S-box-containing protein
LIINKGSKPSTGPAASTAVLETEAKLALFYEEHSADGLLVRYGRGRLKHFLGRQLLTMLGAASLMFLVNFWVGVMTACVALMGEAVDCLYLLRLENLRDRGVSSRKLHIGATLTAGFQALTISGCVITALVTSNDVSANFFAFAFLTGAAINIAMVLPYHRPSSYVRLSIYASVGFGYFLFELITFQAPLNLAYDGLGLAMMAVMVRSFSQNSVNHAHRNWRSNKELLLRQLELERSAQILADTQRESYRLSMVARHASDSVILAGPDLRITWVNDAFTTTTGYTLGEASGQTSAELLRGPYTDDATIQSFSHEGYEGRPARKEVLNYTKDGRKIWMDVNLVPILSDAGAVTMYVAIGRNITATKTYENHLAKAKAAAEDGSRAKAAFLATMSHEIRTPMNGVIGMADLMADSDLTPSQSNYIQTIRDSAESLLKIINDVLDFSKLEADKLDFESEPFSLADCVSASMTLMKTQAKDKGISLKVSYDTKLPALFLGDSGRIRQILVNLLSNAIKFTDTGGVSIQVSAHQTAALCNVTIRVTDTGIGVPVDRVFSIFEQFVQADAATTRQFGGTGLGLAISRQLAHRMNGNLVLDPQYNDGASFVLALPMTPTKKPEYKENSSSVLVDTSALQGTRILVAEDNLTNQMLMRAFLKDIDPDLGVAGNGREAVNMFRTLSPDVILMDMAMPVLDGLEATREIRALPGIQPVIIALTANAFQTDRDRCIAAGMDDFLSKPVRKSQLLTVLREVIAKRDTTSSSLTRGTSQSAG